ncbi:MAG TPA: response regulator [Thermoanaerobaculia bacterium]|nr:response regulator [Thermoanaerobaculia bacterium]
MTDRPGVLIIDGSAEYRTVFTAILATQGYEVVQAHDASAAVEALALRSFAVILLDLKMPHNGIAFLDYLGQSMPQLLSRTIVFVPWVNRSIWGVMSKPFRPEDLMKTVSACALQ